MKIFGFSLAIIGIILTGLVDLRITLGILLMLWSHNIMDKN
jgi:hypothetical protein